TGSALNPFNGVFTWTPSSLQAPGVILVTVRVTDNASPPLSATGRMRVTVEQGAANRAPTIAVIPDQTIAQGARLSVQVSATDPDAGQTLAYSLEPGAPAGAAIDPTTGLFAWTPTSLQAPGVILITVKVTDSGQLPLSSTQRFKVTVIAGKVIELNARVIPGALQLSIRGGDLNQIFTIQQSDDLLSWTPAGTLVKSSNNDVLFNDPSSPSLKKRFYRVLVE
ncbi:MAG: putative Ig domain-containing protein, partial [Verrucomicrobiota bacterium]